MGNGILSIFADVIERETKRSLEILERLHEAQRRGHRAPAEPDALESFERFKARWAALVLLGANQGFLDPDEHLVEDLTPPLGEWVWDETEEEHRQRVNPNGDRYVTFPVVTRRPS